MRLQDNNMLKYKDKKHLLIDYEFNQLWLELFVWIYCLA